MKEIDIIRPCSINAIIGPIGTLKRILKNRDFFESRGYAPTLFTYESMGWSPQVDSSTSQGVGGKTPLKKRVLNQLNLWAKHNYLLACWMMKHSFKQANKLVSYYIGLNRTPDIVQFHADVECYQYLKQRKEKNAKVVVFLHTDGIPFAMYLSYFPVLKDSRFYKKTMRKFEWMVQQCDKIVFIAEKGRENFLKSCPYADPAKTAVFLNGIDDLTEDQKREVEEIRNKDYEFKYRLCCTGTINTRKGHRFIIEALHRLEPSKLAEIHVDFLGDGQEREKLEAMVAEYGLREHIRFLGSIPNVEVYKYLASENIYILMSMNEGLPISIIEAMRAGLPIISTRVAGTPEIVREGYNGLLLNPSTEELLPIFENMKNCDWEQMGKNSRVRYEKELTFERMKQDFCNMYDSLFTEDGKRS
jgi:glycosyltransferase involved in cell wall biosynthesis